jgi:SOS-response transcriptional repressor LexA
MSIAKRINKIRTENNLNQGQMAEALGTSQALISMYLKGTRMPGSEVLESIARKYNVNLNWLLTGDGDMYVSSVSDSANSPLGRGAGGSLPSNRYAHARDLIITLPVVGEISAGPPLEILENQEPIGSIIIDKNLVPSHGSLMAFRVNGDSMEPEIQHGDIVVINKDFDPVILDHQICAFRIAGGITLKRLVYIHKVETTVLFPINNCYDPVSYHWDDTDIQILGVYLFLFRDTRRK